MPSRELAQLINREMPIEPVDPSYRGEVAERWRYQDGGGEVGFISSVTQAFCRDCTRARLSAEGQLYTCLFATKGTDFRSLLRGGATDEEISQLIGQGLECARRPLLGNSHGRDRQAAQGGDVLYRRLSPCSCQERHHESEDRFQSRRQPRTLPVLPSPFTDPRMDSTKSVSAITADSDYDPNSMPVAKAREYIRAFLTPVTAVERLHIRAALGRVLAEDLRSTMNVPAHDNSAMDGYAVRFADLEPNADATLKVVGTSFAGRPFEGAIAAARPCGS